MDVPPEPPEQAGRALYERLDLHVLKRELGNRVIDLKKNMIGVRHELEVLHDMCRNMAENRAHAANEAIKAQNRTLIRLQDSNAKTSRTLEVLLVCFSAGLAFDVLDRLTGEWTAVSTTWMRDFVEPMIKNTPMAWFAVNMALWIILAIFLVQILRRMYYRTLGTIVVDIRINRPIDVLKLNRYLVSRKLRSETRHYDGNNTVVVARWRERKKGNWGGYRPCITIEYDASTSFLLNAKVEYSKKLAKKKVAFNAEELRQRLMQDLENGGILLRDGGDADAKLLAARGGASAKSDTGASSPLK